MKEESIGSKLAKFENESGGKQRRRISKKMKAKKLESSAISGSYGEKLWRHGWRMKGGYL
jgi:hypothetical protein